MWQRVAVPMALGSLALLAAWPVLRTGYPTVGDGLIHFYRAVEFDHLLRHGVWFPRWATDLGYGFGYPVFNYYPPLTYYLAALLHALGLGFASSLLGAYVAAFGLAITGSYTLARERLGPPASLLAAAAYGLAPYLYFDALARGALPETLGLGLLPWVLWAYARLAERATGARFALAALLSAALLLTHLLTALLAAPLIALVLLTTPRPNYRLPIANYLLSLCLAGYFLLPAVLETGYVQIGQLTQPSDLDFHNNFVRLGELLAWPRAYDPRLVFQAVPPSLSLAGLALVLAGGALALGAEWRREGGPRLRWDAWPAGLGLALAAYAVLALPASAPAWEYLPPLKLVQFPWRLVGPASLALALLAGTAAEAVLGSRLPSHRTTQVGLGQMPGERKARGWRQRIVQGINGSFTPHGLTQAVPGAAVVAGLWLFSLTWSFGPPSSAPPSATVRDLTAYETSSGQLGATSTGEFLPRGVRQLPDPQTLAAAYAGRDVIERVSAVPDGMAVSSQAAGVTWATAQVSAAQPGALSFDFFYFPGWRASVDGRPAAITPTEPAGLISVPVPAGQHTVTVRFGPTPLRAFAAGLSLAALLATALGAYALSRLPLLTSPHTHILTHSPTHTPTHSHTHTPPHPHTPTPPYVHTSTLPYSLAALALLALRTAALDGRATPFAHTRFDGAAVAGADQRLDGNFDDQLVLIGLDRPDRALPADAEVPITLYWRAQTVPSADYATTVQVLDEQGEVFGQADSQNPGRVPTSRWRVDQYARDEHVVRLLPGTPPGDYRLVAGVYEFDGPALNVLDEAGIPQGQLYSLGTLTVARARRLVAAADEAIPLGPLALLGGEREPVTIQAGESLRVELLWRAQGASRPDLRLRLALESADGRLIAVEEATPARADYPTSAWLRGEVVRAVQHLRVPAEAPAGPARLRLSLLGASGEAVAGPVGVGSVEVRVPRRSFEAPPMQHGLGADLGGKVKLLGYDLGPDGEVTLYWQALGLMDVSYKVFVHALDASGHILAQADALPLGGARPTTGWLPGEVLADHYSLPLAGASQLAAGLYDESSGERLGQVVIQIP